MYKYNKYENYIILLFFAEDHAIAKWVPLYKLISSYFYRMASALFYLFFYVFKKVLSIYFLYIYTLAGSNRSF